MRRTWVPAILLLTTIGLNSCTLISTPLPTLAPDPAQAFAAQVDATSENVLTAINKHDYAAHTRDMDAQMKAATTEAQFEKLYQLLMSKTGKYISKKMVRVEESGQYRAVVYDARFEQEDHVTVRVVYNTAVNPPPVSGLWFDSPKLRQ